MGKNNLCVRLDGDKLKQFKAYVFNKYGKLYGVMGIEVQQALVNWMNEQGLAAHTNRRRRGAIEDSGNGNGK